MRVAARRDMGMSWVNVGILVVCEWLYQPCVCGCASQVPGDGQRKS